MSHLYFIAPPELTTLEEIRTCTPLDFVQLSNTTHCAMQELMGFDKRQWMAADGSGELVDTLYHTTIWDTEPVFIDSYELQTMLDDHREALIAAGLEEPMEWLYALCANAVERIYIF